MGVPSFRDRRQSESFRGACAFVIALGLAAAACDDGEVRFGPPNNLRFPDGGTGICPAPTGATGETCPEWETDVFPMLENNSGCTNKACHSEDKPSGGLALHEGDATKSYEALAAFKNQAGRPYVADADTVDPEAPPYMLCNVTATPPIGPLMPPSGMSDEDLVVLGNWALCGMKLKGGTPIGQGGAGGTPKP
ncbi:MAG: hypothetical protein FJ095_19055 [Deltaproteobacteria bacterium]|nr:hypothetical protein [Deltaproteobacteria bacterium]